MFREQIAPRPASLLRRACVASTAKVRSSACPARKKLAVYIGAAAMLLLVSDASLAGYREDVLTQNPAGYWRFGEASGAVATDESANGNHGSYINSPSLGQEGALVDLNSAVRLDGTNDYATVSNSTSLNAANAITMEAWVKPQGPGLFGSPRPILLKSFTSHASPYYQYGLFIYDTGATGKRIRVALANLGSFNPVDITVDWAYEAWQHIAATWDGSTVRVYYNGEEVGVALRSGSIFGYSTPLTIGCYENLPKESDYCLNGSVDEAVVYPAALSASTIRMHYDRAATLPLDPEAPSTVEYPSEVLVDNPIAYWRLGESQGTQLRDEQGAHDGTYASSPSFGWGGAIVDNESSAVRFRPEARAHVSYAPTLNPPSSGGITVEAWVRVEAVGPYMSIVSSRSITGGRRGWTLYVSDNSDATGYYFEFWYGGGNVWNVIRSATPVVPNKWFHVVGVLSAQVLHIYVNGVLDDSSYRLGNGTFLDNGDEPTRIGANIDMNGAITYHLRGIADEIAVYDQALHSSRIQKHYNAGQNPTALLARYVPELRYDAQETFRADAADTITDNYRSGQDPYTNRLLDAAEITIAAADPADPSDLLSLNYLGSLYPSGRVALATDHLDEANVNGDGQYASDAARLHSAPKYRNRVYGRVRTYDDGRKVLQYWLWFYYNPKTFLGVGVHEGDWEMIQVHLDASGAPTEVTAAQHREAELCPWPSVAKTGAGRPIIYVGQDSHASYFEAGEHEVEEIFTDDADGNGEKTTPALVETSDSTLWIGWSGRWGGSSGGSTGADSPVGPAFQNGGLRWSDPLAWASLAGTCTVGGGTSLEVQTVGGEREGGPPEPSISARRVGERVIIEYEFSAMPKGRNRRPWLLLTSLDARGDRYPPLTRHTPVQGRRGRVVHPVQYVEGRLRVLVSVRAPNGARTATEEVPIR